MPSRGGRGQPSHARALALPAPRAPRLLPTCPFLRAAVRAGRAPRWERASRWPDAGRAQTPAGGPPAHLAHSPKTSLEGVSLSCSWHSLTACGGICGSGAGQSFGCGPKTGQLVTSQPSDCEQSPALTGANGREVHEATSRAPPSLWPGLISQGSERRLSPGGQHRAGVGSPEVGGPSFTAPVPTAKAGCSRVSVNGGRGEQNVVRHLMD